MTTEEQRLSYLLKQAVPEPPLELSAARARSRREVRPAARTHRAAPRRRWLVPAISAISAGCVAAAVAIAAALIGVPSPATRPASAPGPRSHPSGVTVASVLDQAATALGSSSAPQAGWPAGEYWHIAQQWTCGGKTYTNDTWTDISGDGVSWTRGPQVQGCGTGYAGPYRFAATPGMPLSPGGMKLATWSQLEKTLPTSPDALWPVVRAEERRSFTADPGAPRSGQAALFESIWNLLANYPVPPQLRKALYEVSARIPGVTVEGTSTDSAGRTGTALRIGTVTVVVDANTGQILSLTRATPASTKVYTGVGWVPASDVPTARDHR